MVILSLKVVTRCYCCSYTTSIHVGKFPSVKLSLRLQLRLEPQQTQTTPNQNNTTNTTAHHVSRRSIRTRHLRGLAAQD
jgi:hypothetical protein